MKKPNAFYAIMQSVGDAAGFGIAIVTPLVACILFAVWLVGRYDVGEWVIVVAIFCGLISSGCGAYRQIKAYLAAEKRRDVIKNAEHTPFVPKRDSHEEWHIKAPDNDERR